MDGVRAGASIPTPPDRRTHAEMARLHSFLRIPLLLLLPALVAGCSEAPEEPPNVILISIDTVRADHLGCYGYERDTSPALDAFAEVSTRYDNGMLLILVQLGNR